SASVAIAALARALDEWEDSAPDRRRSTRAGWLAAAGGALSAAGWWMGELRPRAVQTGGAATEPGHAEPAPRDPPANHTANARPRVPGPPAQAARDEAREVTPRRARPDRPRRRLRRNAARSELEF